MKNLLTLSCLLSATLWIGCSNNTNNNTSVTTADTASVEPVALNAAPDWCYDDVMYEVNLRQYSESGTFEAFEKDIPRLREMGVDILWFMPIHPIGVKNRKGTMGSYYSIQDYKAVNPEFGDVEDFKRVVEKAHQVGMKVIIDWVANHSAWDANWINEHPEYYTKDSAGNIIPPNPDWSDVADLNYDNEGLRSAMIDAMKFWVETCDIDGFRCDVAGEVPMDFWDTAIGELRSIKEVFMLAEWDEPKMHSSFNVTYGWGYHHTLMEIGKGHYNIDSLRTYLENDLERYPDDAIRLRFNTNHDENSWKGTEEDLFGPLSYNFQVLAYTAPGMPLLYSGQESGLDKQLEFFEKDVIDWKDYGQADFLSSLADLKHTYDVLLAADQGGSLKVFQSDPETGLFAFDRLDDLGKGLRVLMNCTEQDMVLDSLITGKIVFPAGLEGATVPAYRSVVVEL